MQAASGAASEEGAALAAAARRLSEAEYLLVTAGAGLSADSGLPVFATLSAHPALQAAGLSYDQVVSANTLARDPALFFGFYAAAAANYAAATPHEGYAVIAALVRRVEQQRGPGRALVLTTNIDGMLPRAGLGHCTLQIHGSAERFQCGGRINSAARFPLLLAPRCSDRTWPAPPAASFQVDAATLRARVMPAACAGCGGSARPNVVLFGDGGAFAASADEDRRWAEWRADALRAGRAGARVVVLEVGAGLRVPVLRKRGEELSAAGGATVVRVNPEYPANALVPGADVLSLRMGGKAALLALAKEMGVAV